MEGVGFLPGLETGEDGSAKDGRCLMVRRGSKSRNQAPPERVEDSASQKRMGSAMKVGGQADSRQLEGQMAEVVE